MSEPGGGDGAAAVNQLAPVLGLLAGLVSIADNVPYIRDVICGSTRPHRGTWLIWGVLAIVVCSSQRADGASWSMVMAATQAVLTTLTFLLAIRRGVGQVRATDLLLLAMVASGVAVWTTSDEPIVATACVVGADLLAAAMMVPKTYRDPASETLSTFVLASVAGALAAAAAGAPDPALLLYPVYFCLVNGAIALLIYRRRVALRRTPSRLGAMPASEPGTQQRALPAPGRFEPPAGKLLVGE